MSEKKPGLFKRIFSFALGSKKPEPDEPEEKQDVEAAPQSEETARPIDEHQVLQSVDPEPEAIPDPSIDVEVESETAPASIAADEKPESAEPPATKAAKPEPDPEPQPEVRPEAPAKPKPVRKAPKPAPKPAAKSEPKPELKPEPKPEPKIEAKEKPKEKHVAPARAKKPKPEQATPAPEPTPPVSSPQTPPAAAKVETPGKPDTSKPVPRGKVSLSEELKSPETEVETVEEEPKAGWFKRLKSGLSRSSDALTGNIAAVFTKKKLDEDTLQELEDVLIQADLGVDTAMRITDVLSQQRIGKDVTDQEVREIMADEIEKTLAPVALPLELDLDHRPHVILVIGVNGSGKTTTIGKLSAKLRNAGLSTLLVAGDTFRAAAIEQLKIWGERTKSPVIAREIGADAAGLAFDAYARAVDENHDIVLMDTAGRLQNKTELMAELEKIIRVLKKQDPDAPHTVLLTLDATTGQNAMNQVEIFGNVAGVNGLVMTKLDGTARGGILVAISARHKLPVYFIGVGEQVDDLEPFEAADFARSIAGLDTTTQATGSH